MYRKESTSQWLQCNPSGFVQLEPANSEKLKITLYTLYVFKENYSNKHNTYYQRTQIYILAYIPTVFSAYLHIQKIYIYALIS